ncbi:hypothetical protein [Pseudonocardia spinosispora]|uniref:hypothetical protein n=1 Tax=Pseudonocardia spinosispora TaxID=103441 RepID=UPI0003FA8EFC|nr:hypothetical protein [Pseudonocardia spinosispora]
MRWIRGAIAVGGAVLGGLMITLGPLSGPNVMTVGRPAPVALAEPAPPAPTTQPPIPGVEPVGRVHSPTAPAAPATPSVQPTIPPNPPAAGAGVPPLVPTPNPRLPRAAPLNSPRPDAAAPSTPPNAAPAATRGPAPAGATPTCTDQDLLVSARVDKPSYKVGERPTFRWLIVNVSAAPCSRDLAPALRELVVTKSDGTRVWSDRDCIKPPGAGMQTLHPGKAVTSSLAWAGLLSQPTCTGARDQAGPGTYEVMARLGPLNGGPAAFTITP